MTNEAVLAVLERADAGKEKYFASMRIKFAASQFADELSASAIESYRKHGSIQAAIEHLKGKGDE